MFDPVELLFSALAVLISLAIHEYSHAYAAYKLGDNTAKLMGRLTLNPIKHIDPIGALCMIFFRVGWAKPVMINSRNFKNPKRDFAISAMAGPLSNLLLGFIFSGIYVFTLNALWNVSFETESQLAIAENLLLFLSIFFSVNVGLGIFNLLPIPPFDGSRLLNIIFPPKIYFGIMKYERQIYFGVLAWLVLGDYAAIGIRSMPLVSSNPVLYNLAGILSLSDMIGYAIGFIADKMLSFWLLFI